MADTQSPAHATTDDESGSDPQPSNQTTHHSKNATPGPSKGLSPDQSSSPKAPDANLTVPSSSPRKPSKAAVKKPSWATGDPFFDNMAGMEDSSEYQQYYKSLVDSSAPSSQGTLNQTGLESATASISLSVDEPSSVETSGTGASSSKYTNTGLEHWNRTREEWTKGRWQAVPSPNSDNPALSAIHDKNLELIYDSLIFDRKRLSKPIPLPLVIKVLVSGWKRDGFWEETPAPPPTLSGKGAVATDGWGPKPTSHSLGHSFPQSVNSHVPGFSSTHSHPIQRKL